MVVDCVNRFSELDRIYRLESGSVSARLKTLIAGAAGMVLAFGIAELVHGLYELVPSVFVALSQLVVKLTPGSFVTQAIENLGGADVPILMATMIVSALAVAGLLASLSLRSPTAALAAICVLAAVAVIATFAQPFVSPVATVLTIVAALGTGTAVTWFLLGVSGLRAGGPAPTTEQQKPVAEPQSRSVRSKEAHSFGGIAVSRRNFFILSGSATVAGLAAAGVGRTMSGEGTQETSAPAASSKLPETSKTLPSPPPEASIDVPGMPPLITPAEDFYLIDTALASPRINVDRWMLKVKGAVDNPIELNYKDLLSMPTREADITLSCVSNEVGGGLVSNGRWTGVLLSDVLEEAGVSRDKISSASEQLVGRSVDGWTSGFKTDIALDGRKALVAFGLNGDELPVKHGYPVRLVVPGLYGYVSATKWLTEIELTDWDFDAYWIQRTWSKEGPIRTQSRIDTVKDGERLSAGTIQVGGIAWAPHRGIEGVEISTDDGETWNNARLADQLDIDTWRQWIYNWEAKPGNHTLKVRATDGEGETQTDKETPPHPSGATGYHTIRVNVA
jgi:DMSO/TMAO reductase YedYZ molybdopterin-dependent catalytic subunit